MTLPATPATLAPQIPAQRSSPPTAVVPVPGPPIAAGQAAENARWGAESEIRHRMELGHLSRERARRSLGDDEPGAAW